MLRATSTAKAIGHRGSPALSPPLRCLRSGSLSDGFIRRRGALELEIPPRVDRQIWPRRRHCRCRKSGVLFCSAFPGESMRLIGSSTGMLSVCSVLSA